MAWTTPRTWLAGEAPSAGTLNTHIRDNFDAIGDAWTAYTPVWAASGTAPAVLNGTLTGQYMQAGKLILWRFQLTTGTTTTYGTGNYTISLPPFALAAGLGYGLGTLVIQNGATFYNRAMFSTGSTTRVDAAAQDGTRWSQTSPFTLTTPMAGLKFSAYGFYEAA